MKRFEIERGTVNDMVAVVKFYTHDTGFPSAVRMIWDLGDKINVPYGFDSVAVNNAVKQEMKKWKN